MEEIKKYFKARTQLFSQSMMGTEKEFIEGRTQVDVQNVKREFEKFSKDAEYGVMVNNLIAIDVDFFNKTFKN